MTEHLTDYTLGLYACDDYLAKYGRPKSLAELREHPLIFYIESMLQVGDLDIERHLPGMPPPSPRRTSSPNSKPPGREPASASFRPS
nr:hypothetical protein [Streptomyces sasae]